MLKDLKKVSGLAICSFIFAILIFINLIVDLGRLSVLCSILPTLIVILGVLAIVSIGFKYVATKKFDKYMKIGIVLVMLGILIGIFLVPFMHHLFG